MSWAVAGGWLAVAGTALLTFGTSAQAVSYMGEVKVMRQAVLRSVRDANREAASSKSMHSHIPFVRKMLSRVPAEDLDEFDAEFYDTSDPEMRFTAWFYGFVFTFLPNKLAEIRDTGPDEAVELARFLRLSTVWGILMVGSALALAAACIQLALS